MLLLYLKMLLYIFKNAGIYIFEESLTKVGTTLIVSLLVAVVED